MANHRSRGIFGALRMAIRQFVLHGLPITTTRTSDAAAAWIALPVLVKIGPLTRIKSPRSIPSFRGTLPTHRTKLQSRKPSSRWLLSAFTTPASVGNAQSSSSIITPSRDGMTGGTSIKCRMTGCCGPKTCPDASRKISAYPICPAAPVTATRIGEAMKSSLENHSEAVFWNF